MHLGEGVRDRLVDLLLCLLDELGVLWVSEGLGVAEGGHFGWLGMWIG